MIKESAKMKKFLLIAAIVAILPLTAKAIWFWNYDEDAEQPEVKVWGNRHSQSFYAVKREMLNKIYYDHRETLYCGADFTKQKEIIRPRGFVLPDLRSVEFDVYDITPEELQKKAERMEWEHIVPAQNFGKTFPEWFAGKEACVSKKGKKFKGRACAEQESEEFRYMYTDMYNLYPAIGAVNYLRANYNFTQFTKPIKPTFGSCGGMVIYKNKVEPRNAVKGLIARTYLYMQYTYPRYRISENMASLLNVWNKQFPVTPWECERAYRIEKVQGNANEIVKPLCLQAGMYGDRPSRK